MRAIWRLLTSVRLSLVLLAVVAVLLLFNVVIPSMPEAGLEGDGVRVPAARYVVDRLKLSPISTSPIFLATVVLVFLNLGAVMIDRAGATVRRAGLRPPTRSTIDRWTSGDRALAGTRPASWSDRHVRTVVRGFGYRPVTIDDSAIWAVKHRSAPIGFLVFHLSFFILCLGGTMIYCTRFVAVADLVEGQELTTHGQVLRHAPLGDPPPLHFGLQRVDTRLESGEPVHLEVELHFIGAGRSLSRTSAVNHPASWGATSILVNRAGLAPVLWLQDANGFTLDRVAAVAATRSSESTIVDMAGGSLAVEIVPLGPTAHFPSRDELGATAITLVVRGAEEILFTGAVRPGEAVQVGTDRLVLEELRYWAGFRIVRERGGSLLILGFVAGVVGLVWRLAMRRRELSVVWDDRDFRCAGRSELFGFEDELEAIVAVLAAGETGR